jgi:polysaccharide pyruvyl transferase WcaK-like protein
MSSLRHIMAEIEGAEMSTTLAVANDYRNFRRFAEKQPAYRELVAHCARRMAQIRVALRITRLFYVEHDRRYIHPYDTAIALYLLALSQVDYPFPDRYGRRFRRPRMFWARLVAREI